MKHRAGFGLWAVVFALKSCPAFATILFSLREAGDVANKRMAQDGAGIGIGVGGVWLGAGGNIS